MVNTTNFKITKINIMNLKNLTLSLGVFLLGILVLASPSLAQKKDKPASPPMSSMNEIDGGVVVAVNYSSPGVKERKIWGELVPYGKVWRTGANKATVFAVNKDVLVEGQKLAAGKYALFTIPGESEWTIIFNKTSDQWGAFKHDKSKDALSVKVKPQAAANNRERFAIDVNEEGLVTIGWAKLEVPFRVKAAK